MYVAADSPKFGRQRLNSKQNLHHSEPSAQTNHNLTKTGPHSAMPQSADTRTLTQQLQRHNSRFWPTLDTLGTQGDSFRKTSAKVIWSIAPLSIELQDEAVFHLQNFVVACQLGLCSLV